MLVVGQKPPIHYAFRLCLSSKESLQFIMPLKICYFQVGLIEQRNVCTAVCVTFSKVLAKSRGRESKGG